jgi:putative oxidoreductase
MKWKLKTYPDLGLLTIRIILGLAYIFVYGGKKLFAGPETWTKIGSAVSYLGINFLYPVWGFLASSAEFFGGILILLGLFFRPAAFFIIITMLVAANRGFITGGSLSSFAHPLELGITLLGLFLIGPGKYSLDYNISGRRKI